MHEYPTILHVLFRHARDIPGKTAVIESETGLECTYRELWAYLTLFAKRLGAAGVRRDSGDGYGTRVVVRCEQTIDYIVAMLAVQLAGGVFVPVENNIAEARIIEIMEETDSYVLIAVNPLSNHNYTYIPIAEACTGVNDIETYDVVLPDPDTLAIILFTTGTTGKSKGVMHTGKSFTARFLSFYDFFYHDDEQVYIIPVPLSHALGLNRVCLSIYAKCTMVLLDGFSMIKRFFSAVKTYNGTILCLVSFAVELYLRTCRNELMDIRNQITCLDIASSYSEAQITALREIFPESRIIQAYAATEIHGCYVDHSKQKYKPMCLGSPCDGTDLVFFDEQKEAIIEATCEHPGLIAMKSDTKMLGYWKNPELTENVTRGEYIVLSDWGYKGSDGLYYYLARADEVIISGAYKIAPAEIEEAANSFKGIKESACVPISDPLMGQVPKLFVVMEKDYSFNAGDIYKYLQSKLEGTKLPRHIEEIDRIPRSGIKINRMGLREL